MTLLGESRDQPSVTCLECGTRLGVGTKKDVYSHLMVCLHVSPNNYRNLRDNAESERTEHGRRVLHILNALDPQGE